jgi:hypothetical protein
MLIHIFSQKKEFLVVIYADNFVFAIKKGPESERVSQSFQQMLIKSLAELKLLKKKSLAWNPFAKSVNPAILY